MAQKPEEINWETSSWTTETDQDDIADEVEEACTTLKDAIRDERIARESVESLFKKRKEGALDKIKKAQHHLQFIGREEQRLRKNILDEDVSKEKAPDNGKKTPRAKVKVPHKKFQRSLTRKKGRRETVDSDAKSESDPRLRQPEEEHDLVYDLRLINQYTKKAETIRRLIESIQKSAKVANNPLQTGGAQAVGNNLPTEEGITTLKKGLEQEERMARYYSQRVQERESRIASYRHLITASSS